MIQNIHLLHYLSENTYKKISHKFGLDDSSKKKRDNYICFNNQKIYKVKLFNIIYKQFGHIWFMHIYINFPEFCCPYENFEKKLFEYYNELFGSDIMSDFPSYNSINCDYIEYTGIIEVVNADKEIARLRSSKSIATEQLDRALWDKFKKPHGTIEFCLCKKDNTHLLTLARCHGTALKKRITDSLSYRATGIMPIKVINTDTEKEIMHWLYRRYKINTV